MGPGRLEPTAARPEKLVNLIFVVTAFSNGWLRESHVADVLWSRRGSTRAFGLGFEPHSEVGLRHGRGCTADRDRLVEIDPDTLRVGGVDLYWDGGTALQGGCHHGINGLLKCHVVGLAARDLHPQSDPPHGLLVADLANLFHR
jgi:hypothetical protein